MISREKVERAMRKIEDFYFNDTENDGEALFNSFAKKYVQIFSADMVVTENENKIEHTLAYQEFQSIFEAKLDELVRSEGLTVEEFFKELQSQANDEEDEDSKVFIQVLLSVSDYTSFVEMMVAYCDKVH
jgi:The ARF-like 2 binding protein BART